MVYYCINTPIQESFLSLKHYLVINPSNGVPIYRQLMDQITAVINSEKLLAGDILPSVRLVAAELQVNPMTVSKAYSRLSQKGIIESKPGIGMSVCQQTLKPYETRRQEIKDSLKVTTQKASQLGLSIEECINILEEIREGKNGHNS